MHGHMFTGFHLVLSKPKGYKGLPLIIRNKWVMHRVPFDVDSLRDHRMRGFYEDRYDARKNLVDWDYNAAVREVASIIHFKQFWR